MTNRASLCLLIVSLLSFPFTVRASSKSNVGAAHEVIRLMDKGQFKEVTARFDSTMKKAAPEERLRDAWKSLTEETGRLETELSDTTFDYSGYNVVVVTCKFQKSIQDVRVVFDKEGMIAGLFFAPHHGSVGHGNSELHSTPKDTVKH